MPLIAAVLFLLLQVMSSRAQEVEPTDIGEEAHVQARLETAGAPIPQMANAWTWKSFGVEHRDWIRRRIVEPAVSVLPLGPGRTAAADFLPDATAWWFQADDRKLDANALLLRGQAAQTAGAVDPLTRFLVSWLGHTADHDWRRVVNSNKTTLAELSHMPAAGRMVALNLNRIYAQAMMGDKQKEMYEAAARFTEAALEAGLYDGEDARFLPLHVQLDESQAYRNRPDLLEPVLVGAKLPEWARCALLGLVESGYAHTNLHLLPNGEFTAELASNSLRHAESAARLLQRSWELEPRSPVAATEMIGIVFKLGGAEGGQMRLWFDRAVSAHFDYLRAYQKYTWCLPARDPENHPVLLRFAAACRETRRYETQVPVFYFEIINAICSHLENWRDLYNNPAFIREVMELNRSLLTEPSRAREIPARLSFVVLDAWLCGEMLEARAALARLGWQLHPAIEPKLRLYKVDREALLADIILYEHPLEPNLILAADAAQAGRVDEARKLLLQALATQPEHPVLQLVERRLQALRIDEKLESRSWVSITPHGELKGWSIRTGSWSASPAGGLVNQGDDRDAIILLDRDPGTRYEVRGKFRVHAQSRCCEGGSVIVGFRDEVGNAEGAQWATCEFVRRGRGPCLASVHPAFVQGDPRYPRKRPELREENTFHVRVVDGRITYMVNDLLVRENEQLPVVDFITPGTRVGFGARRFCKENTTMFYDLEMRSLADEANSVSSVTP